MAIQEGVENRPSPLDSRFLSIDWPERVGYGLELFRDLVGSERFGGDLTRLGFNPLQAPFVGDTAKLILPADKIGSIEGESLIFRPDNDQEPKEGGRYVRVYSPGVGVVQLTGHFPEDDRVITGGLVRWRVIREEEAKALIPLFDGKRPFLRLVAMDPSILNEGDLKPYIKATHSDEPNLKLKTFMSSILSIFNGNPLYEVFMRGGEGMVDRYERGKFEKTEYWVTLPPVQGEGFLLVGKGTGH